MQLIISFFFQITIHIPSDDQNFITEVYIQLNNGKINNLNYNFLISFIPIIQENFIQQIMKSLLQFRFSTHKMIKKFFQPSEDIQTLGIALILVRNPLNGKYLAVNEKDGSWWLPGGRIDAPQLFSVGAIRQTKEQGGVDVTLKGILRFQLSPNTDFIRNRIIFYAQPKNPNQKAKDFADKESLGASYLSLKEIEGLKDKWRGPQLYQWAGYVQKGGKIYPMQLLDEHMV